jgi:hypothetical protein
MDSIINSQVLDDPLRKGHMWPFKAIGSYFLASGWVRDNWVWFSIQYFFLLSHVGLLRHLLISHLLHTHRAALTFLLFFLSRLLLSIFLDPLHVGLHAELFRQESVNPIGVRNWLLRVDSGQGLQRCLSVNVETRLLDNQSLSY